MARQLTASTGPALCLGFWYSHHLLGDTIRLLFVPVPRPVDFEVKLHRKSLRPKGGLIQRCASHSRRLLLGRFGLFGTLLSGFANGRVHNCLALSSFLIEWRQRIGQAGLAVFALEGGVEGGSTGRAVVAEGEEAGVEGAVSDLPTAEFTTVDDRVKE